MRPNPTLFCRLSVWTPHFMHPREKIFNLSRYTRQIITRLLWFLQLESLSTRLLLRCNVTCIGICPASDLSGKGEADPDQGTMVVARFQDVNGHLPSSHRLRPVLASFSSDFYKFTSSPLPRYKISAGNSFLFVLHPDVSSFVN